jgi:hypothetical protein
MCLAVRVGVYRIREALRDWIWRLGVWTPRRLCSVPDEWW